MLYYLVDIFRIVLQSKRKTRWTSKNFIQFVIMESDAFYVTQN